MTTTDDWRCIPGYPAYEIERGGKVRRSLPRRDGHPGGAILKGDRGGVSVSLVDQCGVKSWHRTIELVSAAFGIPMRELLTDGDLAGEEWRAIAGFDSYEVSNMGRVKRVKSAPHAVLGGILRFGISRGYHTARLYDGNGNGTPMSIHRLVSAAFHGPPKAGQHANHINGVKTDNRPANLEWVTPSENEKHAYRTGLKQSSGGNAKLSRESVIELRSLAGTCTQRELAARFGINQTRVSAIIHRQSYRDV